MFYQVNRGVRSSGGNYGLGIHSARLWFRAARTRSVIALPGLTLAALLSSYLCASTRCSGDTQRRGGRWPLSWRPATEPRPGTWPPSGWRQGGSVRPACGVGSTSESARSAPVGGHPSGYSDARGIFVSFPPTTLSGDPSSPMGGNAACATSRYGEGNRVGSYSLSSAPIREEPQSSRPDPSC